MSELAHNEVRELYSAYVEHDLATTELERFVTHVEQCDDCMHGLERFEATLDAVRNVSRERVPANFTRRVMQRVKHRNRRLHAMSAFADSRVPIEAAIPIVLAAAIALLIHVLQ